MLARSFGVNSQIFIDRRLGRHHSPAVMMDFSCAGLILMTRSSTCFRNLLLRRLKMSINAAVVVFPNDAHYDVNISRKEGWSEGIQHVC